MYNFYEQLKAHNYNNEYFYEHVGDFIKLSDEDIVNLFFDNNITSDCKQFIFERFSDRINSLSVKNFIDIISWLENPDILINNYEVKINKMTYDEFVKFLYDGCLDISCYLKVSEMQIFKCYLEKEITEKKDIKLQRLKIEEGLYFAQSNQEKLTLIGHEIKSIIQNFKEYKDDLVTLCDKYIDNLISLNKIKPETELSDLAIFFIRNHMKNNKVITPTMLKFYIYLRIFELDLFEVCDNIKIDLRSGSDMFGYFQNGPKLLKIYFYHVMEKYKPFFERSNIKMEETSNYINLFILSFTSHELGHVVKAKYVNGIEKMYKNPIERMEEDKQVNYHYRNGFLQLSMGDDGYKDNHDLFIGEIQANLFKILDSSNQFNNKFKNVFSLNQLLNFAIYYAREIIKFYTVKAGKGLLALSPLDKFDQWVNELLRENMIELNQVSRMVLNVKPPVSQCNSVIESLLLGENVPEELLNHILDISNGLFLTTNLNDEIINFIEENNLDKKHNKKIN